MTDTNIPRSIRFSPVGECVYCGAKAYDKTGSRLGDEHIVPLSLGGSMILPEASCRACERITHEFEYTCARTIFGAFRIKQNFPTRRKRNRPRTLSLSVSGESHIQIPPAEHPGPILVYTFPEPRIIYGLPPNLGLFNYNPIILADKPAIGPAIENFNWDRAVVEHGGILAFVRLLAKIGHCFAIAHCGIGAFEPLAVDLVLGRSNDYPHIVGTALDQPKQSTALVSELIMAYPFHPLPALVMVKVQLFPYIEMPQYLVVVGQTYEPAKIAFLQSKAADRSIITHLVDLS